MNDLIKQLIEAVRAHRKAKEEFDAACALGCEDPSGRSKTWSALRGAVELHEGCIIILAGRIADHQPVQTEGGG